MGFVFFQLFSFPYPVVGFAPPPFSLSIPLPPSLFIGLFYFLSEILLWFSPYFKTRYLTFRPLGSFFSSLMTPYPLLGDAISTVLLVVMPFTGLFFVLPF